MPSCSQVFGPAEWLSRYARPAANVRRADYPDEGEALMQQLQQGDASAFEALVDCYRQSVSNYAARTLGDATEAQDIAQNVFVQVFKAARRFRFRSRVSTWIFTITRNLCLNEMRRRARHPATSLEDQPGPEDRRARVALPNAPVPPTPRDAVVKAELLEKIEEALAALPERQRSAILLIREGGLSYGEIASILAISVPATKALIHCARKELKKKLRPYLRTGSWQQSTSPEAGSIPNRTPAKCSCLMAQGNAGVTNR